MRDWEGVLDLAKRGGRERRSVHGVGWRPLRGGRLGRHEAIAVAREEHVGGLGVLLELPGESFGGRAQAAVVAREAVLGVLR